jgi:hypothetical protein
MIDKLKKLQLNIRSGIQTCRETTSGNISHKLPSITQNFYHLELKINELILFLEQEDCNKRKRCLKYKLKKYFNYLIDECKRFFL